MQIERRFSGSRALFCHALKQNRGISRLTTAQEHDFSKGSILKHMLRLAGPMTLAQLINVLYNIVDRIFIGQIGGEDSLALTGLGVCFPVITIVIAFTNLVGMGGAPLFSITRGAGDDEEAERILGNSFTLLLCFGVLLTAVGLFFKTPVLRLLGASDATLPYADAYLTIYLLGSIFVSLSLGLNSFINAQGFARTGMLTVAIGAVLNLLLDPLFIMALGMGVQGAALATVLSQAASAAWTFRFLTGRHTLVRLSPKAMRLCTKRTGKILSLGMSGFIMAITNSLVQMVCNASLQAYGGDIYVGVMTVINSVREVAQMPVNGITNSAQPIISFNYGAKEPARVRQAIRYMSGTLILYTAAAWAMLWFFPSFFIRIFNQTPALIETGVPAMRIYFFGYFMMALQFCGQSVFTALGKSKHAIFFSIFRKAVIVVPLILILPHCFGLNANGVFLAEPISNFIGGAACFITMLLSVYFPLKRMEAKTY